MPYSLRTFDCAGCGAQVAKRAASGATVFCTPCSIARSGENARQLHARQGPYWERFIWANRLMWRRRARAKQLAEAAEVQPRRQIAS